MMSEAPRNLQRPPKIQITAIYDQHPQLGVYDARPQHDIGEIHLGNPLENNKVDHNQTAFVSFSSLRNSAVRKSTR